MKKSYKAEGKLSAKDIFLFLMRHSISTWQGKVTWALGILALVGAPIVWAVFHDSFTVLVFLIVAVMYLLVSPLSLYSNAKRQSLSNPVFKNNMTFAVDEEMLTVKQYTGENKLFWHQLEGIDMAKNFYLLYVNAKQAFIIPKHFIAAEDQKAWEELLKEQKEKIEKNQPYRQKAKAEAENRLKQNLDRILAKKAEEEANSEE